MGALHHSVIMSLDGYTADVDGKYDWAYPGDEVHAFVNDRERSVRTHIYGRRMYEEMRVWETVREGEGHDAVEVEYADVWRGIDKIVFSRTLDAVSTARTRLVREFEPQIVEEIKRSTDRDLSISGPTLAAHAVRAGLVDDYEVYVAPVVVGGGTRFLPDGVRLGLELVDEHRFDSGFVFLRYVPRS
ncbi:MAG: dihydrofolate reductase family protein [Pseudonocardia sp.]|nr:dihydrofolate reductase family protein [Pseudonocardia sp.]